MINLLEWMVILMSETYYVLKNGIKAGIFKDINKVKENITQNSIIDQYDSYADAFNSLIQCPFIHDTDKYIIYTDASRLISSKSCCGFLVIKNYKIIDVQYIIKKTDNSSIAEDEAVKAAIDYMFINHKNNDYIICTDSQYSINNYGSTAKMYKIKGHALDPFNVFMDSLVKYKLGLHEHFKYGIFKKSYFNEIISDCSMI
jgi:hypothetical protein